MKKTEIILTADSKTSEIGNDNYGSNKDVKYERCRFQSLPFLV